MSDWTEPSGGADVRKEVMRLMREEFRVTFLHWDGLCGEWSDNASDVADTICALFAAASPPPAQDVGVPFWLGIAKQMAYRDAPKNFIGTAQDRWDELSVEQRERYWSFCDVVLKAQDTDAVKTASEIERSP